MNSFKFYIGHRAPATSKSGVGERD